MQAIGESMDTANEKHEKPQHQKPTTDKPALKVTIPCPPGRQTLTTERFNKFFGLDSSAKSAKSPSNIAHVASPQKHDLPQLLPDKVPNIEQDQKEHDAGDSSGAKMSGEGEEVGIASASNHSPQGTGTDVAGNVASSSEATLRKQSLERDTSRNRNRHTQEVAVMRTLVSPIIWKPHWIP